jgi:excisionase family DNA binding protein
MTSKPTEPAALVPVSASAVAEPFEKLLTIVEIAEVLRKTPAKVYNLSRRGRQGSRAIPCYRVGKSLLFKLSEVYRWLEQRRAAA